MFHRKEVNTLAIVFDKLLNIMQEKNKSIYHLTKEGVIGKATLEKIRKNEGHIDTRTVNALCKYLDCQPGDIMDYIPEKGD